MPRQVKEEGTIHVVTCGRCHEEISFKVNMTHDLEKVPSRGKAEDLPAFVCTKHVMGTKCFQVVTVRLTYDRNRKQIGATIEDGTFTRREGPGED